MKTPTMQFGITLIIPLLIFLSMLVQPVITEIWGTEIRLKTTSHTQIYHKSIDLKLAIEKVKASQLTSALATEMAQHDREIPVYVSLVETQGFYTIHEVSMQSPDQPIYLKATLQNPARPQSTYIITYPFQKWETDDHVDSLWKQQAKKGELIAKLKVWNGYGWITELN